MKKIIYLLVWIGMTLASCSDESSLPIQPEIPAEPETPKDEPAPEKDYHQLPVLHVEGRYLKNEKGETVNLHGFTQTYSPFFNDNAWTNYDVQSCLSYNKRMVDGIVAAGWKFNFVRMHLDPYWSDDTSKPFVRYEGHERFSETRFRKYLDELFVPMAEYFVSKGMYVVMRPPGVCPNEAPYQGIEVGDSYQQFLLNVWDIVSQHPKVKNNTDIMFELANEHQQVVYIPTFHQNEQLLLMIASDHIIKIGDSNTANFCQLFYITAEISRDFYSHSLIRTPSWQHLDFKSAFTCFDVIFQ